MFRFDAANGLNTLTSKMHSGGAPKLSVSNVNPTVVVGIGTLSAKRFT